MFVTETRTTSWQHNLVSLPALTNPTSNTCSCQLQTFPRGGLWVWIPSPSPGFMGSDQVLLIPPTFQRLFKLVGSTLWLCDKVKSTGRYMWTHDWESNPQPCLWWTDSFPETFHQRLHSGKAAENWNVRPNIPEMIVGSLMRDSIWGFCFYI